MQNFSHDAAWHARAERVLSGALRLWGVSGEVRPDPELAGAFLLSIASGNEMRIARRAQGGWSVWLREPGSASRVPLGEHAGLPGLLKAVRDELGPQVPAGRLIIGSQELLP